MLIFKGKGTNLQTIKANYFIICQLRSQMLAIKKLIYNYDLFANVPSFRARTEASVVSYFGGIFSIILLGFFLYVFLEDSIKILNYKKIKSQLNIEFTENGTKTASDFKFALGVFGHKLNDVLQYLSFYAYQGTLSADGGFTYTALNLVRCQKSMFSGISNIDNYFNNFDLNETLCLDPNSNLTINGLKSDSKQNILNIQVYYCVVNCANITAMQTFFSQYISLNKYFTLSFFALDTGFNVGEKNATFQFLSSKPWITFTDKLGTSLEIMLGSYNITTDESILPWQNQKSQTGTYIQSIQKSSYDPSLLVDPSFVEIYIQMGREIKNYQRNFGKLDETLGYVGGLFSIVFAFFAFFIMKYGQYRYQLIAGEGAFTFPNGARYTEQDFNFFTYIKYSIYDWIRLLCGCVPQWETCQRIQETRDEICELIDIKNFLRRLSHLQHVNSLKITQDEDLIIHLAQPLMISYAQKKRKILSYCEKVMKGKTHLTIRTINMVKNIFNFQTNGNFPIPNPHSESFLSDEGQEMKEKRIENMDELLKKYGSKMEQEDETLQLTEEEIETEKELAQIFFRVPRQTIAKFEDKIPIYVLHRLNKVYHSQKRPKGKISLSPVQIQVHPNN